MKNIRPGTNFKKKKKLHNLWYYFNIVDLLTCQATNNDTSMVVKIIDINKKEVIVTVDYIICYLSIIKEKTFQKFRDIIKSKAVLLNKI